jgi:hypothetical protein
MIRTLNFDHEGNAFRIEIDDTNDSESSDVVTLYGPGDEWLSNYDTCARSDAALIAEAKREID